MSFAVTDANNGRVKYAGRAQAVVKDNKDPKQKGRIIVTHPLLGDTPWIPYLQTPFGFDVPEPGDVVFVECDGGFATHPVAWGKLSGDAGETLIPSEFQRATPTNRGFYTPGGHLIEIDDGDATNLKKGIRITSSSGTKIHITDDSNIDDKILLEKESGQKIEIDATLDTITIANTEGEAASFSRTQGVKINNATGDNLTLFSGTLTASSAAGDKLEMTNGRILSQNTAGDKITLENGSVNIENATGDAITASQGEIKAQNAAGGTLTLGPTEASVINAAGSGMKADANSVAIGGPTAEVVDILVQFLQELSTDTFAGFGAVAGKAAIYAQLAAKLSTIKGSL